RGADPAEEWLAGPMATIRVYRLLAQSLDQIAQSGKPTLGRGIRRRPDGRLTITAFPASRLDAVMYGGFSGEILMAEGLDQRGARERQPPFAARRAPEGGVLALRGAATVAPTPPMDVASKMFVEGFVAILKMNPVNEWAGPHLERALAPLIDRGYLRIVYGGAEVGSYLCYHPLVDDVHITGSDRTHDAIVWGAAGPERDRPMAANQPVLAKPSSSPARHPT